MLLNTRDVEIIRDSSYTNHQDVVRNFVTLFWIQCTDALYNLLIRIQTGCIRQMKVVLVPKSCVSDWFNYAPKLERPHSGVGEERGEEKVVPRTDDYHVKKLLVGLTQNTVASVASPEDNQPLSAGFTGAVCTPRTQRIGGRKIFCRFGGRR